MFFVARQATATTPLLPLRLFRSRNVSGANVILMLLVAGLFGMFFLGTLYLERVLGYDAIGDPRRADRDLAGRPGRQVRRSTDFRGFGRCPTDDEGAWEIFTLKPGRVDGEQAPHIDVSVFARGTLNRTVTRIYFADDDNAGDPVLASVPE